MTSDQVNNQYRNDLEKNQANYQALTPLGFLQRAAAVFPDHTAIAHGAARTSYRDFYSRSLKLASALSKQGVAPGETVSVMLANPPAMLEVHYGVPMAGAVLHAMNTRLDAAIIAFQLDHAETKVLITDREFAPTVKAALELASVEPLVIDEFDNRPRMAVSPVRLVLYGFLKLANGPSVLPMTDKHA